MSNSGSLQGNNGAHRRCVMVSRTDLDNAIHSGILSAESGIALWDSWRSLPSTGLCDAYPIFWPASISIPMMVRTSGLAMLLFGLMLGVLTLENVAGLASAALFCALLCAGFSYGAERFSRRGQVFALAAAATCAMLFFTRAASYAGRAAGLWELPTADIFGPIPQQPLVLALATVMAATIAAAVCAWRYGGRYFFLLLVIALAELGSVGLSALVADSASPSAQAWCSILGGFVSLCCTLALNYGVRKRQQHLQLSTEEGNVVTWGLWFAIAYFWLSMTYSVFVGEISVWSYLALNLVLSVVGIFWQRRWWLLLGIMGEILGIALLFWHVGGNGWLSGMMFLLFGLGLVRGAAIMSKTDLPRLLGAVRTCRK
jgi:hypothetical protein